MSRAEAVADMNLGELEARALRAASLLKAMANPVRLLVLCQLAEGEKSVGELEGVVEVSQSALSQHLALLRQRKLVKSRGTGAARGALPGLLQPGPPSPQAAEPASTGSLRAAPSAFYAAPARTR
jgi:hypothetical protein